MLQAEERRSVKQKAQAFTSGQSRSRLDSGTVERCARQPRGTAKILCAFDAIALQSPIQFPQAPLSTTSRFSRLGVREEKGQPNSKPT